MRGTYTFFKNPDTGTSNGFEEFLCFGAGVFADCLVDRPEVWISEREEKEEMEEREEAQAKIAKQKVIIKERPSNSQIMRKRK